jgi:hypothetical protein
MSFSLSIKFEKKQNVVSCSYAGMTFEFDQEEEVNIAGAAEAFRDFDPDKCAHINQDILEFIAIALHIRQQLGGKLYWPTSDFQSDYQIEAPSIDECSGMLGEDDKLLYRGETISAKDLVFRIGERIFG